MGNKPYVAIGRPDGSGELVDFSDVLGALSSMKRHIPFDEFRDASIMSGDLPPVSLTENLVASHPRISFILNLDVKVNGIELVEDVPIVWVAEVMLDLNMKEWTAIARHLFDGICTLNGKASIDGVWKEITVEGPVTDDDGYQEKVPIEGEGDFGSSWSG